MTITAFDRTNLAELRKDLEAAFATINAKHGISVVMGKITYAVDGSSARCKMEMIAEAGKDRRDLRNDKLADDLQRVHSMYFPDLKLAATYQLQNGRSPINVKIVGYNTRGRLTPIIVRDVDTNKQYKVSVTHLRNAKVVG